MILTDKKIKEYIKKGIIVVDPFDESMVNSASLDVRLGFKFRVFKSDSITCIDLKDFEEEVKYISETEDRIVQHGKYTDLIILKHENTPFIIHPGEFVLACVYEYIKLPDFIAAQIHGKSSLARLGIIIHTSAGWIDPGYSGHLTLEIVNVGKVPVKLYPLMKIAQIQFFELPEPCENPYYKRGKFVEDPGASLPIFKG